MTLIWALVCCILISTNYFPLLQISHEEDTLRMETFEYNVNGYPVQIW